MTKTLGFACVHMSIAFSLVYLIAGGLVALVEPCCNTLAYFLHEKVWARYGRPAPAAARMAGHARCGRPGRRVVSRRTPGRFLS